MATRGFVTTVPFAQHRATMRLPWWMESAIAMCEMGLFFYVSYGFALWATAQREVVPSVVFGWERAIPFLAWTIVPYWALNVFYATSFFFCQTREALRLHMTRLVAVQLIAVAVFVVAPLRFSFSRPMTEGVFGWMFAALESFDMPFNQAPSLHVALAVVLGVFYASSVCGVWRWVVSCGFWLIALTPLTTYQHHFLDVPTGTWLGLLCLTMVRDGWPDAVVQSRRSMWIACCYFAGAAVLVVPVVLWGGIAWWLLWPAGACTLMGSCYVAGRPWVFGRCGSAERAAAKVLLAPYQAGVWLNRKLWARRDVIACEVSDGIWLGRVVTKAELTCLGIRSVVCLAPEVSLDAGERTLREVPVLDLTVPGMEQLDEAVAAIIALQHERPTLVCCALGYSRSAITVAAWLIARGVARNAGEVVALLGHLGRRVVLRDAHRAALDAWAERRS